MLFGLSKLMPNYVFAGINTTPNSVAEELSGSVVNLSIGKTPFKIGEETGKAVTVNGSLPAPLIRLKEGEDITLNVTNTMTEDTSIHWHGLLLPFQMDGVPGLSFAGIKPGETFKYQFPVKQSGTYWYHSHSGMQELTGMYGGLIVEPTDADSISANREHMVVLSDWTDENPMRVFGKLKNQGDYYNFNQPTVVDFFRDMASVGLSASLEKRQMWNNMRMSPSDLADLSAETLTYLMNGTTPAGNWTGLFKPGERVRLRLINSSAMTYFDVRVPGLPMTVISADGQPVQPVETDEFRIGVAETYDVIVQPTDTAHTVFAQSQDRSGYVRGTLATRKGMEAPVPPMYPRTERGMAAMGMGAMSMGAMGKDGDMNMDSGMDMGGKMEMMSGSNDKAHGQMMMNGADSGMNKMSSDKATMNEVPTAGRPISHGPDNHGPGAAMVASSPQSRLDDPGVGFETANHRVLTYSQLQSIEGWPDKRPAEREVELHLTGNMERYMWSFDGKKFSEVDGPVKFYHGERLRLILVNDSMMDHPIHLHGMWMELETGAGEYRPRKHTISVKPGERVSALITADAPGDWAFHCHLLYHMDAGMFRVVSVV